MRRTHLTSQDCLTINRHHYNQKNNHFKPHGLWYAIENEWMEWCASEMPHWLENYKYSYELDLDMTHILVLETEEQVTVFNKQFGKALIPDGSTFTNIIDWIGVRSTYKGIEVRNYHDLRWSEKLWYSLWLTSWDVNSGCVWDLSCVKEIRRTELPKSESVEKR